MPQEVGQSKRGVQGQLFGLTIAVTLVGSILVLGLAWLRMPVAQDRPASASRTPAGWQRLDVGPFSVAFPPGWTHRRLQGRDSMVGVFQGPNMSFWYEYGWYSNPLPEPDEPGYAGYVTRISCKVAHVVAAIEEPATETGVFFPRVYTTVIIEGERRIRLDTQLEIRTGRLEPAQRDLALRIFETVHFPWECLQGERGEWEILEAPEGVLPMAMALHSWDEGWVVGGDATKRRKGEEACASARWEAGTWTRVPCPAGDILWGLSLTGPDEGWAVGGSSILRLHEGTWSVVSDTVDFPLFDVLAEGGGEGWAVGLGGGPLRLADGVWRPDDGELEVEGITVARHGESEVYAGGIRQLFQRDRSGWRRLPSPVRDLPEEATVHDFVPRGGESGWFAGVASPPGTGLVWRRSPEGDVDWQAFPDTGAMVALDVQDVEGDLHAWAVGGDPNPQPATVLELDGDTWHAHRTPFGGVLLDVDMASPEEGWAVGWRVFEPVDGFSDLWGFLMRYRAYPDPPPRLTPAPADTPGAAYLPWTSADP